MNRLIISLISLALVVSNTIIAADEVPSKIPFYILNAANAYDVDVNLMYALCMTESKCRARAINHNDGTKTEKEQGIVKKSYGLFQLQVETAKGLGFQDKESVAIVKRRHGKDVVTLKIVDHTKDLLKPDVNAMYAAKLLRKLYNRYHNTPRVLSAYNAGAYTKANNDYVLKVLKNYVKIQLDRHL